MFQVGERLATLLRCLSEPLLVLLLTFVGGAHYDHDSWLVRVLHYFKLRGAYHLVGVFLCRAIRAPEILAAIMGAQLVLELRRYVRVEDSTEFAYPSPDLGEVMHHGLALSTCTLYSQLSGLLHIRHRRWSNCLDCFRSSYALRRARVSGYLSGSSHISSIVSLHWLIRP